MRIVFDTNVILDAIGKRPEYETAQTLISAVAHQRIEGYIAASSVTDIFYIAKKDVGEKGARDAIEKLLTVFHIVEVNGSLCKDALKLPIPDFEDAVVAVCASRAGADFIVSRDEGFLKADSPVPVKRPKELIEQGDFQ